MLEKIFAQDGTEDRVDRILALTEKPQRIQSAANTVRYDEQLAMEIPEVLKTLGDAKDAVIAELKLV